MAEVSGKEGNDNRHKNQQVQYYLWGKKFFFTALAFKHKL